MTDDFDYQLETLAIRAGQERSQFGEHAEALYLTSSFVADNAAQAAARFTGAEPGFIYSRFTNPTVTLFQDRLAALEGAEAAVADFPCVIIAPLFERLMQLASSPLANGSHGFTRIRNQS